MDGKDVLNQGMKEETNNEVDLLLRRLGRRPDISVTDGNGDVEHLDADELSAYAENVLPTAARARYTEHLAECSRCRELVAQLSSSAGVVPAVETVNAPVPSAVRKFLASLFSPLVLRYAVPALGLIFVAAIGLFVSRSKQSQADSIAQRVEAPASKTYVAPGSPETSPLHGYADTQQLKEQSSAKPAPSSSGSPGNEAGAAAPVAPPAAAVVNETSNDALAKKENQQPTPVDVPAAGAPKPTVDARDQQAKAEREAVQVTANEPPAEKSKTETVKVEDRKAAEVESVRSVPAPTTGGSFSSGVAGLAQTKKQRDDAAGTDKDNKNAETKSVAGRRFRKQDGVWVDTAYSSARNAVNVTRGSEQYRALIADEPEIKKIADQLDGEIIVVWKGHTYRIR